MTHHNGSRKSRTQKIRAAQTGFTLLELAFVFIVFGIMVAFVAPSASFLHQKTMADDDRRMLRTLKQALIGQVLATGQLPVCRNAAGAVSATGSNCDAKQTLEPLGVRWSDGRGSGFVYDVLNDAANNIDLTAVGSPGRTTAPDVSGLCNRLDTAITLATSSPAVIAGPRICLGTPDQDNLASYGTYCTNTTPVAFLLVGTGANRPGTNGEGENLATRLVNQNLNLPNGSGVSDRIFENPARRHVDIYDDLVETVTLQELRAAAKCN